MERTELLIRLENTERALFAMWSIIKDTMPPAYADSVDQMMEQYYNANSIIGMDNDIEFKTT